MPTLHLIDGSGYLFRAYHALPPLSTSHGVPTGAVRGVAAMLLKDLRAHAPTHFAVCMDLEAKERRAELYADYKANRPPPPPDLVPQFKLARDVMRALGLPVVEKAGYEADDCIATLTRQALEKGYEVVVVSGDKDLMQLVDDGKVRFYDGMKDAWFDDAGVRAKWGVSPRQVGDLLALTGDTVDNVPGVPGIGPKTAASLLEEFGSLDALLERASEIKRPKIREAVLAHLDQIRLARRLVELESDVDLGLTLDDLALKELDGEKARALFNELEMFTLLKDLPQPKPTASTVTATLVQDEAALQALAKRLESADRIAFQLLLGGPSALKDSLVGLSFALADETFYVPIGPHELGRRGLSEKQVLDALRPALEAETPRKDAHSAKKAATALLRRGIRLRGLAVDVELASFLCNSARREHALADLARERLNVELPSPPMDSRKRIALQNAPPEQVAPFACAGADAIARLAPLLEEELRREEHVPLYEDIERPLIPVLSQMETMGIRVDVAAMRTQSAEIEKEMASQLRRIHEAAGREFNVAAPAQLAEVLFDTLGLPVIKRGKTGPSTDAEVLEKLAEQHPLPQLVLDYRGISKLKNTYLDTLPELVADDGRIHTTFNQLGAATGRLSSEEPNLQNIPIRTDVGRRIRAAFVADPGYMLVSADYSQIELRILAHVSGDAALVESFRHGEDVHTRTAAEIYGVRREDVQPEMRRVAKMINYAIAYGLSAFGLSSRLGIPTDEARRVIDAYFARYSGVKSWLDETVQRGRELGYVSTLLGRRRQLADLKAKNPSLRMAAERAAVNAPIQGTAADIVKRAMLRVDAALREQMPEARMLLQVHDELLFEVPEAKVEALESLVRPLMEGALELDVPLVVDIGHGTSWSQAH